MRLIIEDTFYGGTQEFELNDDGSYNENELRAWFDIEIDDMYLSVDDLEDIISRNSEAGFDRYFVYTD